MPALVGQQGATGALLRIPGGGWGCPAYHEPVASRISPEDVAHVAKLARLELAPGELEVYTEQLASVLDHFADIDALDLAAVEPMTQPYPLRNVLREDVAGPCLDRDEVLAQAPAAEAGRFRGPAPPGGAPGASWRSPPPSATASAAPSTSSRSTWPGSARTRASCTPSTSYWPTKP